MDGPTDGDDGDAGQLRPMTGIYRFKTNLTMAGGWRSPRRKVRASRDVAGEAGRKPYAMRRTGLFRLVAVPAAGAGGYWAGSMVSCCPVWKYWTGRPRRRSGARRHGRSSTTAIRTAKRPIRRCRDRRTTAGLCRRACQPGSELRSGGGQSSGCRGGRLVVAHHSLLPQSDGPS